MAGSWEKPRRILEDGESMEGIYNQGKDELYQWKRVGDIMADENKMLGAMPKTWIDKLKGKKSLSVFSQPEKYNLDLALFEDQVSLKEAEHYINQMRPSIFEEIAAGGLLGSATLYHELREVTALKIMGYDIHRQDHLRQIKDLFDASIAQNRPDLVPFHLQALHDELTYARRRFKEEAGIDADLSEVAKALYNQLSPAAEEKMFFEMSALALSWSDHPPREDLLNALQVSHSLRRR